MSAPVQVRSKLWDSFARLFGEPATILARLAALPDEPQRNRLRVLLALDKPTPADVQEATRLATMLGLRPAAAPAPAEPEKVLTPEQRSAAAKATAFEVMQLGRQDFVPSLPPLTVRAESKKAEVSGKNAGDHVFNDPFQAVVKVLTDEHPLVKAARARIQRLAEEWSRIRDQLRAYGVPSREGISDSNALAFGMYNEQLLELVSKAYDPSALPKVLSVLDGMLTFGLVDAAAYDEVSAKHATELWAAQEFLVYHRADLERALRTLLEIRGGTGLYLERLRFAAARYAAYLAGEKPLTTADDAELRDLCALLGEDTVAEEVNRLLDDAGLFPAAAKNRPTAAHLDKVREIATAQAPALDLAGAAAMQPGAPAVVLHDAGHFHLLLPLGDGTAVDLDVQPDGNCLAHAVAWADLMLDAWVAWVNAQPGPIDLDVARKWLARQVVQQAPAEAPAALALRAQIAAYLQANRDRFAGGVLEVLMHLIGLAYASNQGRDPGQWFFPQAGVLLTPALQAFCAQHADGILAWKDVLALLKTEPGLVDAYLAAVEHDPHMWLGTVEISALKALRSAPGQRAVQVCLLAQAPPALAIVDVSALTRPAPAPGELPKPKSSGKTSGRAGDKALTVPSAGGDRLVVPRWTYPKLTPVCFLQDSITAIFRKAGWSDGNSSEHVLVRPKVPGGLELHASLTQKSPLNPPYVSQIEFVLLPAQKPGEARDRVLGVRFWYGIMRQGNGPVRLEFQGNISANDTSVEAARRQLQSDENERAFARYLSGLGFDPSAAITEMIIALQDGLSILPVCTPPQKK